MTPEATNTKILNTRSRWRVLRNPWLIGSISLVIVVAAVFGYLEDRILSREAAVRLKLIKCGISPGYRPGWLRRILPRHYSYSSTFFGDRIVSLGFTVFPRIHSKPLDDLLPELQQLESLHELAVDLPVCERFGFSDANIDDEVPILRQLPSIRQVRLSSIRRGEAKRVFDSLQRLRFERLILLGCEVQDDEFDQIAKLPDLRVLEWIPGITNHSQPGLERFQKLRPDVTVRHWKSFEEGRKAIGN